MLPVLTSARDEVQANALSRQAPLSLLVRTDPETKVDKGLPLGFGTLYETATLHGKSIGEVYFDLDNKIGLAKDDEHVAIPSIP